MRTWRRLGTLLTTGAAKILTAIWYCLLLIVYCLLLIGYGLLLIGYGLLLLIGYGLFILTLVALFFGWPLLAGWWLSDTDSFFTPGGWTAEHVWLGLLAACFVVFTFTEVEDAGLVGLLVAWPVLAWAVGSDYTGYALGRAGWTAEWIWLGVMAACIAVVIVIVAVRRVIALVRK